MKKCLVLLLLFMTPLCFSQELDIQGHRGARGLLPENTIPAFIRAIEEGVTTLELDVVITSDKQVILSHEPYISSSICTRPDGISVAGNEARNLNIYEMTYQEVAAYDCGSRGNSRFPGQQKMKVSKPLLKDMIEKVEAHLKENNLPVVGYNIELKSSPSRDKIYHPVVSEFSDIVQELLSEMLPAERYTIQCFDFRVLRYFHKTYPDVRLVALVENAKGVKSNLKELGFTPEVYSPYFKLIGKKDIDYCHSLGMKVIPWTINELKDMQKMVKKGVDGIITDYPDRARALKP